MNTTCGIYLFNNDGEILLGHPTNHHKNFYSIPKGKKEIDENYWDAAIRELKEETNIDLLSPEINETIIEIDDLGMYVYKHKKKQLRAFSVKTNYDFSNIEIKCNSFVEPKTEKSFPEFDGFLWIDPTKIKESNIRLHKSQMTALEEIFEKI